MIFGAEPKIKEKGIVRVKGPLGTFTLQKGSDKPIVLLATGTGYAPIRSILLDLIHQNSERQVHFYWGARQQEDLYALEEAEALLGRLKMRNSRLFFLSLIPIGKGKLAMCKMLLHKIILI